MATINLTNAPFIQCNFIVTQAFSNNHHALDLAPYGGSQPLYAIDDFTVIYRYDYVEGGSSYGNYFIAKSNNAFEQRMYLYAHLASSPPAVGDVFSIHQYVGMAGRTGTATGIHLHLEMQRGTTWNYNAPIYDYINPCDYLTGIVNVASSSNVYYYDGTPYVPPTDEEPHKFPWFIFDADPDILG